MENEKNDVCTLCPRHCNTDRKAGGIGFCGAADMPFVAKYDLHFFEEPCISGSAGSGAVFFCGCNLSCIFCQNRDINHKNVGIKADVHKLADIMLELQEKGAHNINLVTPTPHSDVIIKAVQKAKTLGLNVPIVYNTNGYECTEIIKALEGIVDIYLPDFKYGEHIIAGRYSAAPDYFSVASRAVKEMYTQCGELQTDENGIAQKGVVIRHLVLPAALDNTRSVLDHIADNYPKTIHISLMSQYVPYVDTEFADLNRKLTKREYERAVDYCNMKGFENVYIQKLSSAKQSYTPDFAKE
ncbi:MAG: radical SAM protein [Clostridia bacterium]|nr:radical SAM protein [Clostridia bacterium]